MTQCFQCCVTVNPLRSAMSHLVATRWRMEPDVILELLHPSNDAERREFQRLRRIQSDDLAVEEIYICADDDCLIEHTFSLGDALRIFADHPDFGLLSLWPNNSVLQRWTPGEPERYHCVADTVYEDEEVMEHVSVGGIRFCRKGLLTTWPALPVNLCNYDSIHAAALRAAGYRVGYFKDIKMNHLGRGYSVTWEKA